MTQGRPGRLRLFYEEEAGRGYGGRGLSQESPIGSCSLTHLSHERFISYFQGDREVGSISGAMGCSGLKQNLSSLTGN